MIFCGFMEMFIGVICLPPSGFSAPASIRQNVVFPVPFSPIMTMISESVNSPPLTVSSKPPSVFIMLG